MSFNLPACSTLPWDTTNNPHSVSHHHHHHFHHHSPHQHDSGNSWKTYETFKSSGNHSYNKNNLNDSDNQSKLTTSSTSNNNNKSNSGSTIYTLGPIDGNLYATITKPNKVSISTYNSQELSQSSPHHQQQRSHLTSFKQPIETTDNQKPADMSYNESLIRSSVDSGISSTNSISNSRPMTSVSTFLPSPSPSSMKMMNVKTNNVRLTDETNNNIVMPNGYKSGSVVNVEAIVHPKPDTMVETKYLTNSSSVYTKSKSIDNNNLSRNSETIPGISEAEQQALDELLSGMLKEVENFPDYPMYSTIKKTPEKQSASNSSNFNGNIKNDSKYVTENVDINRSFDRPVSPMDAVDSFTPSDETDRLEQPVRVASPQLPPLTDHFGKMEPLPARFLTKAPPTGSEDEKGRPYHARPGSQPFSYGITKSSPALQRRRVVSESTAYVCESKPKPSPSSPIAVSVSSTSGSQPSSPVPMIPAQTSEANKTTVSLTERSLSIEEHTSPPTTNGHYKYLVEEDADISNLTWLQKQQLKLKNRHEGKDLKSKDLVLAELRGTISRQDYDINSESRSSSPSQTRTVNVTSSSPISRSPLVLPSLTASPIPRTSQPVQLSIAPTSPTSPQTPPTPLTPLASAPDQAKTSSHTEITSQTVSMLSNLDLNEKSRQSPSIASTPTSPTYSRPLHVNINETRTTIGTTTNDSPSTPNMYSGAKPPLSTIARQNSIPSTPPHYRYASASGSISPLTYTQIKDNYGQSPDPGRDSPSVYFGQSQRSSLLSLNESDIISQHPTFIKDTSKFWYKPNLPREDAIKILLDKPPGTFIIRDSTFFPGAFGLALKVAQPPPDVQTKSGDASRELVRHFLIEPTSKGVRIKGCPNEPVFASLSALVYQHSITPLALSCKLIIPDCDLTLSRGPSGTLYNAAMTSGTLSRIAGLTEAADILAQGAACNVLYLLSVETESLTGPLAVRNSVTELLSRVSTINEIIVHFKVSNSGITLTDNSHRNFFRRHYPLSTVSHFGLDPEGRCYKPKTSNTRTSQLFGFVARARGLNKISNNECHLFVEFDEDQAASAIVNFANKVILSVNRDDRHK